MNAFLTTRFHNSAKPAAWGIIPDTEVKHFAAFTPSLGVTRCCSTIQIFDLDGARFIPVGGESERRVGTEPPPPLVQPSPGGDG